MGRTRLATVGLRFAASTAGAMVALVPDDPAAFAVPGGEPPEQLHVTLAYLGPDATTISADQRAALDQALTAAAAQIGPITATTGFVMMAPPGEDGEAAVCLGLDSAAIVEFNDLVGDLLDAAGIEAAGSFESFVSHLTLGYKLDPTDPAVVALQKQPITFSQVATFYGGDRTEYALAGTGTPADCDPDTGMDPADAPADDGAPAVPPAAAAVVEAAEEVVRSALAQDGETFAVADDGTWEGVLIVEGLPSGDGRMIEPGALSWRELPLTLMSMLRNPDGGDGHDAAVIAGRIDWMERRAGATDGTMEIWGGGVLDLEGAGGQETQRLIAGRFLRGVSADLCDMEVRWEEEGDSPLGGEMPFDAEVTMVVTSATVLGVTCTAHPAFSEAYIVLGGNGPTGSSLPSTPDDDGMQDGAEPADAQASCGCPDSLVAAAGPLGAGVEARTWLPFDTVPTTTASQPRLALVAGAGAGYPVNPPLAWFERPDEPVPGPVRILPDGRVAGYAAMWGSCHIGFAGQCVPVPRSASDYRLFRTGQVLTREGVTLATGPVCMDTVHPDLKLSASDAASFYAHTAAVAADVAVYELPDGMYLAGAARPGVTPQQVRAFNASDGVSPDWRTIDGRLECVAMLAVNNSGFKVLGLVASAGHAVTPGRPAALVRDGAVQSLVAAGHVPPPATERERQDARLDRLEAAMDELRRQFRPLRAQHLRSRTSARLQPRA